MIESERNPDQAVQWRTLIQATTYKGVDELKDNQGMVKMPRILHQPPEIWLQNLLKNWRERR